MTHNLEATVFVYRHRETGEVRSLYTDDARAMTGRDDYEHVATLEPRAWIEHHFDDVIKEREACAKVCDEQATRSEASMEKSRTSKARDVYSAAGQTAHWMAEAIRSRGNP